MTPNELIERCDQSINSPILGGSDAKITLTIKGRWGTSNSRRLADKGSPVGRIVSDGPPGYIIVLFSAQEVKQYAQKLKQ
jgi:hypothetical protein